MRAWLGLALGAWACFRGRLLTCTVHHRYRHRGFVAYSNFHSRAAVRMRIAFELPDWTTFPTLVTTQLNDHLDDHG